MMKLSILKQIYGNFLNVMCCGYVLVFSRILANLRVANRANAYILSEFVGVCTQSRPDVEGTRLINSNYDCIFNCYF